MTPTDEQLAIIDAAKNTPNNLIISALAGAAKTSTLVLIAEALPKTSILCLAFNKRIADEMTARLPINCTAMTLNSLGHRAWAEATGKRLTLDIKKNFTLLGDAIKKLPKADQRSAYDALADLMKVVDMGKSCGYIPTGHFSQAKRLMDSAAFFSHLEDSLTATEEHLIEQATIESLKLALNGNIDFGDQILMPTVFPAMFPSYPLVMVDEAQDLSALNHMTLRKMAKKRLIAVGDECQAIYGFRGAHEESMSLLQKEFQMQKLILSTSFRCPIKVVKSAQWRAPHMKWPTWAKEGEVKFLGLWTEKDVPETAAIICRNNAPLFTMAIRLLKNGRYPNIVGNDIGKYLLKVMKKFGPSQMKCDSVIDAIHEWANEKAKKTRNRSKIDDQAACLKIFAKQGKDLGEAIAYAEHLFASQGPIQLMTGHKSKGLEFDTVIFLDQHLIDMEEGQEKNLRYVIQTRAKDSLIYVMSEDFRDNVPVRADMADEPGA